MSGIEQVDLAVDRQLKLAFHHIADLFALVLKYAGRMPAWLDDHHKAFEQPAIRMRDDDLCPDAFAAGPRCVSDHGPFGRAQDRPRLGEILVEEGRYAEVERLA